MISYTDRDTDRIVGRVLLELRRDARLSCNDIEAMTGGEFCASRLTSYERGERTVKVVDLLRLAEFYDLDPYYLMAVIAYRVEHPELTGEMAVGL